METAARPTPGFQPQSTSESLETWWTRASRFLPPFSRSFVSCRQSSPLDGVLDGLARRKGSRRESLAQGFALQKLHHDVGRALLRADVVDRGHVGVVQAPGGLRLPLEATQAVGVEEGRQHLDRDLSTQSRISRAVDLSHAARADLAENLVRAEA
jgi:hypothetical protein